MKKPLFILITGVLALCAAVFFVVPLSFSSESSAPRGAVAQSTEGEASAGAHPASGEPGSSLREEIQERFGSLCIHGGVVGFYQGMTNADIAGRKFRNPDGVGFVADLELAFSPLKGGQMTVRIHAGEGDGADRDLEAEGGLFADVNTINDDNPGDDGVRLLDVFYTQTFFDGKFSLSVGKTEPLGFIDDNAFANDEYAQFVGKPFVNNPVLDSENEYAPLVALSVAPAEEWALTVVVQSSSRPLLDEDQQKGSFERVFDKPFAAGQVMFSPAPAGLEGNYRIYGWAQTYDHPRIAAEESEEGWGIGLSLDQKIHEKAGLFGRFGYQNEDVYEVPWFWSAGASLKGLLPVREEDEWGLGIAGLKANKDLEEDGMELHLETYWRFSIGEHFAVTPDLQYILNPLGDEDNDGLLVGTVRAEAYF